MHAKDGGNTRFLVCGGDGTVGWALQDLDKLREAGVVTEDVLLSVLPLGTGNDMARTLRCGGGYNGEALKPILDVCAQGKPQLVDRWKVNIQSSGQDEDSNEFNEEFIMCNYFSIGWDAKIARQFHRLRESKPHLFKNRAINKAWYVYFSVLHLRGNIDMSQAAILEVDGKEIKVPENVVSINVVNIPSYLGGTNLWGTRTSDSYSPQLTDDGKLEIVGYTGALHMLGIRGGYREGIRIAQGKEVVIKTKNKDRGGPDASKGVCCQVDGEPYVVDGKGFHKEVDYVMATMGDTASVKLCVRITHHAVSTLVAGPVCGRAMCML
jgi:diacylglycerol kinase (ATP)